MTALIVPNRIVAARKAEAETETAGDKTDIIVALREVAKGIEQGHPDILGLAQIIGTELLVYALKYGPALEHIGPEETETLVRTELGAVVDTVAKLHENRIKETDLIEARLMRMFDPTLAFNEAVNRAIAAKKESREDLKTALDDLKSVNKIA